jgi:single-stranded-DNA-specific exonuclease
MQSPSLDKRWIIATPLPAEVDAQLSGFHPILRQLLYNRGQATEAQAVSYLRAEAPEGASPINLLGMQAAVDRLLYAMKHAEPVAIYGDYDADGVTATALLVQYLRRLGADVRGYIPNRFDEGYGLNIEALQTLREQGIKLVITVDCGIRSPKEASFAREIGLDLIITDHHHPGEELPEALAILNPKQAGDNYPDKNLAGVGLAYKLAAGVDLSTGNSLAEKFLDLVALGTVSDLAPLTGENRSLVRRGLEQLRNPQRQGILSLIGVAGLNAAQISAGDIGYLLGPRLNAAGRLESALASLELLTTDNVIQAAFLAQQLDVHNQERQRLTREIQENAERIALQDDEQAYLLFAAHPDFNPGVVGLAASRLMEVYYRPAIVAYRGDEFTRASCRSIQEFHITDALAQCAELMEHHGGHAAAAGFTVRNENLQELISRLKDIARAQLERLDLRPTLHADMEIPLRELKADLLPVLESLQPTGIGNRRAQFVTRNLKVLSARAVGRDGAHLKLAVSDGWITFDGIAFRQGHWANTLPARVDLLHTFERNEYNGRTSLQLNILDIKPAQ